MDTATSPPSTAKRPARRHTTPIVFAMAGLAAVLVPVFVPDAAREFTEFGITMLVIAFVATLMATRLGGDWLIRAPDWLLLVAAGIALFSGFVFAAAVSSLGASDPVRRGFDMSGVFVALMICNASQAPSRVRA